MSDLVLGGLHDEPKVVPRTSVALERFDQLVEIAADRELLVPLMLWLAPQRREHLGQRRALVLLGGADDPFSLHGHLDDAAGVAIQFPDFNDGRGYSHAALLRGRLDYRGQIRAVGDVLRDQLFLYLRCGFDAFEPRADHSTEVFIKGYAEFRQVYQRSVTSTPLFARRPEALASLSVQEILS